MPIGEGVRGELVEEAVTAPFDVGEARVQRVTVEVDGGESPRDGASDEQTSVLDERLVTFRSSEPSPAGTTVRVSLVDGGDTGNEAEIALPAGEDSSLSLRDGSYVAALYSDRAGLGPLTSFTVAGEDLSVEVGIWKPFEVSFELRDGETGKPLAGGRARFEAVCGNSAWMDDRLREAASDEAGMVRFEDIQPGEWRLTAEADGYGKSERVYDLPGEWVPNAEDVQRVDLRWFPIPPITPLLVQLVGDSDWPSLTEFKVSHTHEGEQVAFDELGLAELELGWFVEPLYLKVWYPDGRAAISYLENGMPPEGEPHPIAIGGDRRLEIDLRFAPGVAKEIRGYESAAIRVSFMPKTGDAMFVGKETYEEGVFVFESVQAGEAIVNFATSKPGGGAVDWKTQWIDLKDSGTSTCTLLVDQRPVTLTFVDGDEQPVPGYNFEVRQLPNTTSWVGGGTCDEFGQARMARILERPSVMIGWVGGPVRFQAYDLPIQFPAQGDRLTVNVGDAVTTHVEVQVAGRSREGVALHLRTRRTDLRIDDVTTDSNGHTPPIELVRGSQLDAWLSSQELWCEAEKLALEPGRNVLTCFETGELLLNSTDAAERIRSSSFGVSVAGWLNAERVVSESTAAGRISLRVPVGDYVIDAGLEGERTITVTRGSSINTGI